MVKQLEKIFKALGDKNRLRIIHMLSQKPMCVCEINSILPLSQSTVSGHLRVLKDAELVEDTKTGLWVEYHLNSHHPVAGLIIKTAEKILAADPSLLNDKEAVLETNREILCKK